ncbi:hypothetical protein [Pseudomonas kielensis]|uniref:Uncharacterized protein n=1 Tax=Pseudomonas kielensis TaxID=2762577 RepID=A0A7X1GAJ5_9PSED|nr:hypothetical protein [Pseudomonas kielensis]MBC2688922.1 hypothetical protein [Pseudomonas kielensis]
MNHIKTITCGLLLSSQIIHAQPALAATQAVGSIALMDKDKFECFIPVPAAGETITYDLVSAVVITPPPLPPPPPPPCHLVEAREFGLIGIPSATEILFSANKLCNTQPGEEGEFWFRFKTIKNPTTLNYIEMEYLKSFTPPNIVGPGLQLIDRFLKPGNPVVRDKLACVQIKTSAAPPTP